MRSPSYLTAALAAGVGLAVCAGAQETKSGYVGAGYANDDDGDGDVYSLDGAYFNKLGDSLDLQADVSYARLEGDADGVDAIFGQLHLFVRDPDAYAVGGFGFAESIGDDDDDASSWGLGGEGEVYGRSWTLGAAAGWMDLDAFDGAYGGCGYGRFYPSEDLLIEGRAAMVTVDAGPFDVDVTSGGLGAEYMLSGSGFSLRGGVDHADSDDFATDVTTFLIGARYHFGSSSLRRRDREGAGMPGAACIGRALRAF